MAPVDADEEFIRETIALAGQARERGDHPFGALLVLDGTVVLSAMNSVATDNDPTAHAETNLVDQAIKRLAPDQIARAVLYTSCEPCAMCVGKMYWAGIRSLVYGLSSEDLGSMTGGDFLIPCRELFERARQVVDVKGPLLSEEAEAVHVGFW